MNFLLFFKIIGSISLLLLSTSTLLIVARSEVWRSSSSELNDELDQSDPNVFDDAASAAAAAAAADDDDNDNVEIDETVPIE
ncbi:hypothetical protein QR98_0010590, partial [Sarcoptes scabiei]